MKASDDLWVPAVGSARPVEPTQPAGLTDAERENELEAFWLAARMHAGVSDMAAFAGEHPLGVVVPPAWSFSSTPAESDRLADLVVRGAKVATAEPLWDFERAGQPLPAHGEMSILTNSAGHPLALLRTDAVRVVAFASVDQAHVIAEGEPDHNVESWRAVHRRLFARTAPSNCSVEDDTPVVLERFRVLYPKH